MALGQATMVTVQNNLKTRYPQKKLREMNYAEAAFLGTLNKDEKFSGNNSRITVNYGRSQGSADVNTAFNNVTADDDAAFLVTRARDFHIIRVSSETIDASADDAGALMKVFDKAHKNGIMSFKRSISQQLYRNGGGARGRLSSTSNPATNTVTLVEPSDAVLFEVNMYLQASLTDGTSGTVKTGQEAISKINRNTGALTSTSAAWNTVITTMAASDFLFRAGDFGVLLKGLSAWIPATDPTTGDNFFGVDRSADVVRLAGVRFAANAGAQKEDTLIDCAVRVGREGAMVSNCYVNNLDKADIVKNLGSKANYDKVSSTTAEIGYEALILEGDKGKIKVLADPNCPRGTFYMLQLDEWTLGSLGAIPKVDETDGRMLEKVANSDSIQWRLKFYGNLYNEAPGHNAVGTF